MDCLIEKDENVFCPMCNRMCEQDKCIMFKRIGDEVGECAYAATLSNFSISNSIEILSDKIDRHNELLQFIAEQVAK